MQNFPEQASTQPAVKTPCLIVPATYYSPGFLNVVQDTALSEKFSPVDLRSLLRFRKQMLFPI